MKTKALISLAVTAKLICVFVFAYAKSRFSHNEAHLILTLNCRNVVVVLLFLFLHRLTEKYKKLQRDHEVLFEQNKHLQEAAFNKQNRWVDVNILSF